MYALTINYTATKHKVKRRKHKTSIQIGFPVPSLFFLAKFPAFLLVQSPGQKMPSQWSKTLSFSLSFDPPLFCSKKARSYFHGKEEGGFSTVLPFLLQKIAPVAGKGARNVRSCCREDEIKAKYGHSKPGYSTQAGTWQALAQRTWTRHGRNPKFCQVLIQM